MGEDIDLLVLVTVFAKYPSNVYYRKPGKPETLKKNSPQINSKVEIWRSRQNTVSVCITGGGRTSAIFSQEKMKFLSTREIYEHLSENLQVFKKHDAVLEMITTAGKSFLVELYAVSKNNFYYLCSENFGKSITKSKFKLAALPPTRDAL